MSETRKQMVTRAGMEVPRRICVDLQTPTEAAIRAAIQAVEQAPAHLRMTDAVSLLVQALDAVADAEEALNPSLATATPPTPPEQGDREFAICVWCNARVEWVASADRAEAEAKLREHSATCREHPAVKALALARATPPTPESDAHREVRKSVVCEKCYGLTSCWCPPTPDRAAVREALVSVLRSADGSPSLRELSRALGLTVHPDARPNKQDIADALLRPAPLPADVQAVAEKVIACGPIAKGARLMLGSGTKYDGMLVGSHVNPLTFGEVRAMADFLLAHLTREAR